MAIALALIFVAVGSVLFHFMSPWWWTPIASNWSYIDHTIIITFWITGVAFAAVVLFMAYCVVRFRHREGNRAHYEPESKRLEMWLTVATGVGVAAMLAPGLFVWHQYVTVPEGATELEVVGQQWRWAYRLPGKDGKLGTSDTSHVSADNALGVAPNDPNGQDDVIVDGDDLHVPTGKPIKVLLRSIDVLHNFYVPEFRAKMDFVPGMVTYFWITPTRTGTFDILCAELCGTGHSQMRGTIVVDDEAAYQAWLSKQKTVAELVSGRKIMKASAE
jgi:cytochrome c oxidase subunit 2